MASFQTYMNIHVKQIGKVNPGSLYDKTKTIAIMEVENKENWIKVVPKRYITLEEAKNVDIYRKDVLLKRIESQKNVPEEYTYNSNEILND